MQRIFDILLSGLALLLLSPLLGPVAVFLRFTGEGEIFFLQSRVGRHGRDFFLYKFATMLKASPSMGSGTVTLKDDPRILPAGKLLRKTKINELPQLLNIFFGSMSFIGPRPQTHRCFNAFPAQSQEAIVKVRPGLSGIGSIVFRDEEELMQGQHDPDHFYDYVIMPFKGQLEEWYVQHQNLYTYFMLMALTVWVVLIPGSTAVWKVFRNLPRPGQELATKLGLS